MRNEEETANPVVARFECRNFPFSTVSFPSYLPIQESHVADNFADEIL